MYVIAAAVAVCGFCLQQLAFAAAVVAAAAAAFYALSLRSVLPRVTRQAT
jgi:hypothetical protein